MKSIKEKIFKEFKDFWCFIEDLNKLNNNFIWRGHSNANWRLSTTWNRYRRIFNDSEMTETLMNFEKNLARGSFSPFDESVSKYKWLELARHYGVPTPLIDFSYSPYVALFFACSEINDISNNKRYGVLYALDITELSFSSSKFFCGKYDIDFSFFEVVKSDFNGKYVKVYGEEFWKELKRLTEFIKKVKDEKTIEYELKISFIYGDINNEENIFPENELFFIPHPSSFNKRMIKQHGCFIYDTFKYKPYQIYGNDLEDFISKLDSFNPILYKLYFPIYFISDILYKLDLMNINGVNLYMDENGAVIDTKNMKNYNSSFKLSDSKIKGYQNDRN